MAENIVTMWPNSMVMIGEIPPENPQYHYEHPKYGWFFRLCSEDSTAVVFTLKRESEGAEAVVPDLMDFFNYSFSNGKFKISLKEKSYRA